MPFDTFDASLALGDPRWVSDTSAWIEHIPFAFAAVDLLRPRVFAELGTHKGDSYLAFCQAISHLQLSTKCFAIDTWAGDAQAGRYGASVLATFRAQHDPLYAGFSSILQSTFDAALSHFAEASIDLLHIDGLHTYDAVKHDFEAWLPKLSPQGVVLFHDIAVLEGDFGVHQLWAEVAPRYPHFAFTHGYGLGMIAVGDRPPEAFLRFCQRANEDPVPIRQFFAALGQRLELARALSIMTAQLGQQLERLNQWRAATQQPALVLPAVTPNAHPPENLSPMLWRENDLKRQVDQLDESLLNLVAAVGDVVADDANVRKSLTHATDHTQELTRHTVNLEQLAAVQRQRADEQQRLYEQCLADLAAAHATIQQRDAALQAVHRSRLWRWGRKLAKFPLLGKYVDFPT